MIDRTQPPAGGTPRLFEFPDFRRHRLANGLQVLAARMPSLPLVAVEMVSPCGAWFDPPGREGLTTLHAGLLDEGSRDRSALEIALAVEQLGARLACAAGWNATIVEASGLAEHRSALLDLLAEVTLEPAFPGEELERARSQRLAELLRRRSQPSIVASERFSAELYRGTPYGSSLLGSESSVRAIGESDLHDFFRTRYLTGGSTCLAVGDFDPEAVLQEIEDRFSSWPAVAAPELPEVAVLAIEGLRVLLVDRPEAEQTELRIGHVSVPRSHPDRPAMVVLNAIFGGKFTSRINLNLRERHGFTYGASSRFPSRLGPGPFSVSTAVGNKVAARAAMEVLGELRRIRDEEVETEELEDAKSYLLGVFPYTLQTTTDLMRRFEEIAIHDLPDGYYDDYLAAIRDVDRATLRRVAREQLDADDLIVLAAGPADALAESFSEIAEPEIVRS